ncbi:AI-2E family transporter [Rhodococcus aerolatus]
MTTADRSDPRASSAAAVSWPVRVAASWAWRLLLVAALVLGLFQLVGLLFVVVVPIGLALLASALLTPGVGWLQRHRVPRGLATGLVMVGGLLLVAGVLGFVVRAFANGLPELENQVTASIESIRDYLINGPLGLSPDQLTQASDSLVQAIRSNQEALTSSAFATAASVSEGVSAALLALFTLIFFLHDGRGIWSFLIRVVPRDVRDDIDVAGQRGFASLVGYVRATVAVAAVDAVGIGIGLAVLGVPLALPLAALVFLGAFVPIVGAVVTGLVAVLVALVANGFVVALIVLGVVLVVMQVESHVLQPFLMGRAVKLHPLAVVVSIATGLVLGGIVGALLIVPAVAFLNAAVRSLQHPDDPPDPPVVDVTDVDHATPGHTGEAAEPPASPGDLSEAGVEAAEREREQARR